MSNTYKNLLTSFLILWIGAVVALFIFASNTSNTGEPQYQYVYQPLPHLTIEKPVKTNGQKQRQRTTFPHNSAMVFEEVNLYRVSKGLHRIYQNNTICKYTAIRAEHMQTDYSHDKFVETVRIMDQELLYTFVGENLSQAWNNPKDVVIAWSKSPTHDYNLTYNTKEGCVSCKGFYCVLWVAY